MKTNINIRNDFGKLDALVLLSPIDVAAIIGAPTVGAVYTALSRGELPEPFIRCNRRIRWTVGQIRAHIEGLMAAFNVRQSTQCDGVGNPPSRTGRRRAAA